jgi:hypothetical protein
MADLIQNRDRLATLQQQEQQPQEQQQEQQHEPQQHEQRATLNYDAQHKRYYSVNPATGVPTWEDPWVGKTAFFLEFSLCLSRACLGKMMHFI